MDASQTAHDDDDGDAFVAQVRALRCELGQPDVITDPGVYNILTGLMADAPTPPTEAADRRRRAASRSRGRVPYP